MLIAWVASGCVAFRVKKRTLILLLASAVVFPLGRQSEIDLETTSLRNYVSWGVWRISPYFDAESTSSRWAMEKLGLRSRGRWEQVTFGPIWLTLNAGTPPGNWLALSTMHRCYVQAPDSEKGEVCAMTQKMLNAAAVDDRNLQRDLHNEAVKRWLR